MEKDLLDVFLEESSDQKKSLELVENFSLEKNLSLILPFVFGKKIKFTEPYTDRIESKILSKDLLPVYRTIDITSLEGPLNGIDQDVLICLMSLAKDQGTSKPVFTLSNIIRNLDLSPAMSDSIKKSIKKMTGVRIVFNTNSESGSDIKNHTHITSLIKTASFLSKKGRKSGNESELNSVEFDESVFKNLMKNLSISISRERYNSISNPGAKRMVLLLESGTKEVGQPIVVMELSTLCKTLGLQNTERKNRLTIKNYVTTINSVGMTCEISFIKKKEKEYARIYYKNNTSRVSPLEKEVSDVYNLLKNKYINYSEYFNKHINEDFLLKWSMKYHRDQDFVVYSGMVRKKIYLVVEILLDQYLLKDIIKNFHALIEATYSNIEINNHGNSCFFSKEQLDKFNKSEEDYLCLPKNVEIVKKDNSLTVEEFKDIYPTKYKDMYFLFKKEHTELMESTPSLTGDFWSEDKFIYSSFVSYITENNISRD